jgi:hypothetical protein
MGSGKWFKYFQFCLEQQYWLLAFSFGITSFGLLPIFIFYRVVQYFGLFESNQLVLGRIAILDEARGKKRLIGITDY